MKRLLAKPLIRIILLLLLLVGGIATSLQVLAVMDRHVALPLMINHYSLPTPGSWWNPSPGTSWQWQLSGEIDTSLDVQMYDIDLFDVPQQVINQLHRDGRVVICYFSAGTYEDWRPDVAAFPAQVLGDPLLEWPGERWLDIRQIGLLEAVMSYRLDLAMQKNCDGVELDNMDGYINETGFPLEYGDQLAYNT